MQARTDSGQHLALFLCQAIILQVNGKHRFLPKLAAYFLMVLSCDGLAQRHWRRFKPGKQHISKN